MKSVFTSEYELVLGHLITARKAAGLTQRDLATRLGKPQSFVSKYERRERRLDVVEFVVLARALVIDPCAIVREVDMRIATESRASE